MSASEKSKAYENKVILAPMVRIGTLPTRLLALEYGADLVYSEELIDHRLLTCQRIVNDVLGSVDFVDEDGRVMYRTCSREKGKNVLQMGTCCPERARAVAKLVKDDVFGIDVNMGCPKTFSIKGGMGAALLNTPDKIEAILKAIIDEAPQCAVTCKIRVFDDLEKTLKLCERIEQCGVVAIGVHGRTKDERQQHPNRNSTIKAIADRLHIPVIANGGSGEISSYGDIERFCQTTGASSVMIARAAESNASIFRKNCPQLLPIYDVIRRYLELSIEYDNAVMNSKHCVQQMLGSLQETPDGKRLLASQQMEDICDIWGLREKYLEVQERRKSVLVLPKSVQENRGQKRKMEDDSTILSVKFLRGNFTTATLPKTQLLNYCRKQYGEDPSYKTISDGKKFISSVSVGGRKFSSESREKNKRNAEQATALAALIALNLVNNAEQFEA